MIRVVIKEAQVDLVLKQLIFDKINEGISFTVFHKNTMHLTDDVLEIYYDHMAARMNTLNGWLINKD